MHSRMTEKKIHTADRKAFSLIELLIVILIISIVYFLGFSSFEKQTEKVQVLTPLNLKSTLIKSELFQKESTLICINDCKNCYLRAEINSPFQAYDQKIDLKGTEAYTLDANNALQKMEYGRYKDKKICLKLDFYNNGSSTQIILKQKGKVYFLPAFFGEAKEVDSIDEAKDLWLSDQKLVSNSGDFY